MKIKHHFLRVIPLPKHFLYKGKHGYQKTTSRRTAIFGILIEPHPRATELHGVYWKKENIPDIDEVFEEEEKEKKTGKNGCPFLEDGSLSCF